MGFFIYLKYASMLLAPAILSVFEIIRILKIKKRNGNVIYKSRSINYLTIIMSSIYILFFLFLSTGISSFKSLIYYILVFWVVTGAYIEASLTSFLRGIYNNVIIFPGYTCEWEDIENVIYINSTIRFIHKEKGAFDFNIHFDDFEKVKMLVKNQIPNSV